MSNRWWRLLVLAAAGLLVGGCGDDGAVIGRNDKPHIRSFVVNGQTLAVTDGDALEVEDLAAESQIVVQCLADDEEGEVLTYKWTGQDVTDTAKSVVTVSSPTAKRVILTCTVSDPEDGVSTATLTLVIGSPELKVTLAADADNVARGAAVHLTTTVTKPKASATVTYTFGGQAGTWTSVNATAGTATWTAPDQVGIYRLSVVAVDSDGHTAGAVVPVAVQ